MREHIDGVYIANAIRMKRLSNDNAVLMVEGYSDYRFFENIVNHETTRIQIADGKENALEAIQILNSDHANYVLAVVDKDFDELRNRLNTVPNLLYTDHYDLEWFMLTSSALDKVVAEYSNKTRLDAFLSKHSNTLIHILATKLLPLASLRYESVVIPLNMKFEGLKYHDFIKADDLTCDVDRLLKSVSNNSNKHDYDYAIIKNNLEIHCSAFTNLNIFVNGHDLIELLSFGFRKTFSSKSKSLVDSADLSKDLRLAYDYSQFKSTNLFRNISLWSLTNGIELLLN